MMNQFVVLVAPSLVELTSNFTLEAQRFEDQVPTFPIGPG
jgi:hypothetical protein